MDTTQKMKRIPFSLELAKQGVAFYVDSYDEIQNFYVCGNDDAFLMRWVNDEELWVYAARMNTDIDNAFHYVPDEPKPERWAVVYKKDIFDSKEVAMERQSDNYSDDFIVVKLAD